MGLNGIRRYVSIREDMRIPPLWYAGKMGSDVSFDDSVSLGMSK
jgi:hypothetical protein